MALSRQSLAFLALSVGLPVPSPVLARDTRNDDSRRRVVWLRIHLLNVINAFHVPHNLK